MTDETTTAPEELRTFATLDTHGGKVSQRVEVLPTEPTTDGPHEGLVAVRGEHPLGAIDEHTPHTDAPRRGATAVGWVDPADLRDWYRPDRLVVPIAEARSAGLEPGLFADTLTRGRLRIGDREGHLGPDGRPALRALAGPADAPVVDAPLPREQVVRIIAVLPGASEVTDVPEATEDVVVVSTPLSPILPPGIYPDRSADRPGLPPAPDGGPVRVRAFVVSRGERSEIERLDERANTMWVAAGDGSSVPVAVSAVGPDLVRYTTEPA